MKSEYLPIPEEIASLLSEDTDRKTTSQMWAAFRTCYATEEDAITAAKRNTGTILPYLSSPSNILGSYKYIVQELGVDAAREICRQNPGREASSITAPQPNYCTRHSSEPSRRRKKRGDKEESLPSARAKMLCGSREVPHRHQARYKTQEDRRLSMVLQNTQ
jgi:ribosomal protein L32